MPWPIYLRKVMCTTRVMHRLERVVEKKRRTVKRNRQRKRSRSSGKHISCGSAGLCSLTCISPLLGGRTQGKLLLQHVNSNNNISTSVRHLASWWCFVCQSPLGRHAVFPHAQSRHISQLLPIQSRLPQTNKQPLSLQKGLFFLSLAHQI